MSFAKVIVDVPSSQTNKPFTYSIPDDLQALIVPGMRVVVPFGKRKLQGFVTDIDQQFEGNFQIKAIQSVIDDYPVINQELLELADWLSKSIFSFKISIFDAILPNFFKAKYKKYLVKIAELDPESERLLQLENQMVEFNPEKYDGTQLKLINKLRSENKIEIDFDVESKIKDKTISAIKASLAVNQYQEIKTELPKNAKKQLELIDFLQAHLDATIDLNQLDFSSSVIKTAVDKGWVEKVQRKTERTPVDFSQTLHQTASLNLNQQQQIAFEQINQALQNQPKTFLLQGITGSGKTEVYMQSIDSALKLGKQTLMLVPEIALTPQIVNRLRSRFGDKIAVLHSALSDGERYDQWQKIENNQVQIVVGTRSAIFAPLKNIGLLIVDEEHDTSYKQEENPRYSAIDVVNWRAKYHQATVILGSATPSLESRARAQKGLYQLLRLDSRAVKDAKLPEVKIVDMRSSLTESTSTLFSPQLIEGIKEKIAKNEQVILMLNRRGFSSFMICRTCGYIPRDQRCDIALTVHFEDHKLRCHYCGHEEAIPTRCPNCNSTNIKYFGFGTEKVVEELQAIMPTVNVSRVDYDTTRRKGSLQKILTDFENHQSDILVGTQMIAKGLDFENVTLVGIVSADTSLGLPDFRSGERTFQLLTQVAGRAGRAKKAGEVIIQTYNPDYYAIALAKQQDYDQFYLQEMNLRHLGNYSPYFYTIQVMISHPNQIDAAKKINQTADFLRDYLDVDSVMLGPSPRPLAKLKNQYYYQIIIKYKNDRLLSQGLQDLMVNHQKDRQGSQLTINKEPSSYI